MIRFCAIVGVKETQLVVYSLTVGAFPTMGQAVAVHRQVVDWDPRQCESAAHTCVPGVRVQRQAHDEETDHSEGDGDDQRHLRQDVRRSAKQPAWPRKSVQVPLDPPWRVSGGVGSDSGGWASPKLPGRWRTSGWRRQSWWAGRSPQSSLSAPPGGTAAGKCSKLPQFITQITARVSLPSIERILLSPNNCYVIPPADTIKRTAGRGVCLRMWIMEKMGGQCPSLAPTNSILPRQKPRSLFRLVRGHVKMTNKRVIWHLQYLGTPKNPPLSVPRHDMATRMGIMDDNPWRARSAKVWQKKQKQMAQMQILDTQFVV